LEQVLWENSVLFEAWRGGISHAELMKLAPWQREKYIEIAIYWAEKKRNKAGSSGSQVPGS